jgi:CBS domain-containing protein
MTKSVAEVMTAHPITVSPQTPLSDAIKIIAEKRISGMPVVDDNNRLVGVISESDLMWKETGVEPPPYIMILDSVIYLQNPARYDKEIHKVLGQIVNDVMSKKPISIHPQQTLREAAHLMHEKNIRRLPVIEENTGAVVGILTRGDIIRSMAFSE